MDTNTKKFYPQVFEIESRVEEDHYVHLIPNVEFAKVEARPLHVHLLIPYNVSGPLPLIIWIQGCAWGATGAQDPYKFIPELVQFAKEGYVIASIEHRMSHEAVFPAQIQDVKAAIRFLRANASTYKINSDQVGIWGNSSGGHLSALVGTSGGISEFDESGGNREQSSRVQAVVDWYGPTDLLQMSKFPCDMDHDAADSPESLLVGGPIQEHQELVRRTNPITYLSEDAPPFLIIHGDQDYLVPHNQSILLHQALLKSNHDVTMYTVKGAGHGTGFGQTHLMQLVKNFFDKHLKEDRHECE